MESTERPWGILTTRLQICSKFTGIVVLTSVHERLTPGPSRTTRGRPSAQPQVRRLLVQRRQELSITCRNNDLRMLTAVKVIPGERALSDAAPRSFFRGFADESACHEARLRGRGIGEDNPAVPVLTASGGTRLAYQPEVMDPLLWPPP